MEKYYCIHTDCVSNTWGTVEVETYLNKISFLHEDGKGSFLSQTPFICISLVKITDFYGGWSLPRDYDSKETNYIDIIIEEQDIVMNEDLKAFLHEFERFLGFRLKNAL
ncbi:hypothetical protein [Anaerocolumna jejuensis]|uniref:hypothetical protein n=1 Tax=Anaerocolumna jejuensis TaxID=259063 RepID=UPI003F7CAA5E